MVDANEKDETPKSNSIPVKDEEPVIDTSTMLSNMKEQEQEDEVEDGGTDDYEDEDDEEYDEEEEVEDEYDEDGKEPDKEGEDVNNEGRSMVVVNDEGINTSEEHNIGKAICEEYTNKENNVKQDVREGDEKKAEEQKNGKELGENSNKKDAVREGDEKEEQKRGKELGEDLKKKEKRPRPSNRNKKKVEQKASGTLAANGDEPESSRKKNAPKRVESMGMVFMCSSKTKTDCFRYKVLGLPANKKDQVAKIYKGMRLFLFDVDLRLMYGIFKAAGPGGYNIEPKAFKSDFPSQVRFTVLEDCLPVAEERFKEIIKENYYTRNKFEGLLKAEQVKKLCKLFKVTSKGVPRPKAALKPRRTEPVERRSRADDALTSRDRKKRKRRPLEEERRPRPRSPRGREKRRYMDYERAPILYEHEAPPVPRYLPLPPPVMASPVRSYGYERPLEPYVRDPLPEPHTYRVLDVEARLHDEILNRDRDRARDRDRDLDRARQAYYMIGREAPAPRETFYTLPPAYHIVSSRDYHPPAVQPPEYRLPGGSHVPRYHDAGPPAPDYRSHRTLYRY